MIPRRRFLGALAASLLVAPGVLAKEPRTARVVWFATTAEDDQKRIRGDFASRGFVEGRNFALTFSPWTGGTVPTDPAGVRELAVRVREAVAGRPDAIVWLGDPLVVGLEKLTRDVPVVFYNLSLNPVKIGLVETFRRPGKNFTGTVLQWDELMTKYWQLLKDMRPSMKRGGVLFWKDELEGAPNHQRERFREAWRAVARDLQIEIREIALPKDAAASSIAAAVRDAGAEVLQVEFPATPGLIAFVSRSPIPTVGYSFSGVRAGRHIVGVGFDWTEGESQAIAMVARILRGERPATIPVYATRSYPVAVNLRIARAVGIKVPESILIQATRVFE